MASIAVISTTSVDQASLNIPDTPANKVVETPKGDLDFFPCHVTPSLHVTPWWLYG